MKRIPKSVNILGIEYKVKLVKKLKKVDIGRKDRLLGQIDYDSRTIRMFDGNKRLDDLLVTFIHEILHGIVDSLHIKGMTEKKIDRLAVGIADTFVRNGMIKLRSKNEVRRCR